MAKRFLIPFAAFVILAVFLAIGLGRDPREVPSPLVGKPAPAFRLPILGDSARQMGPSDLRGKVWLLNVWASWCPSCRDEHAVLMDLARDSGVPIYGLNYKDSPADAIRWLMQLGNPYAANFVDVEGRVGIDYGVYGTPETYVIDRNGVIRHKHVGPVTPQVAAEKIIPWLKELQP